MKSHCEGQEMVHEHLNSHARDRLRKSESRYEEARIE